MRKEFIKIDLTNNEHCDALISLLNDYMEDEMGWNKSMPKGLGVKVIEGLTAQNNFIGFFVRINGEYAGLANCFINFSTWQAKQLLNIHDLIVSPNHRRLGVGEYLLNEIHNFCANNEMCKVTLEVRDDNTKAQALYKKVGYKPMDPEYLFWTVDV